MGGKCSWTCTGRVTTSLLPGFKKFRWESRGIGYLGISYTHGTESTFLIYSSNSGKFMPMSRKARPTSSRFGTVCPTENEKCKIRIIGQLIIK